MEAMKVLVCGPRDWVEQKSIERELKKLPEGTIVVHGGAKGVDEIAGFVAKLLGFKVRRYRVDHDLDGPWPAAGPRRNKRMLESEHPSADGTFVDLGLAFARSEDYTKGTGGMVRLMLQKGVKVEKIVRPKDGIDLP